MIKRMLIDDTQPEETRVVVINGNKLEDVEFETSHRKQIKGNIYLGKVMRVEPSLQACFVDYGGNKHGFMAFGEIHPDYYNLSKEELEALDKEVDEIIENKKNALKEREAERERIRLEKATAREAALKAKAEAQAAKEAAQAVAAEGNTEETVAKENAETAVPVETSEVPETPENQEAIAEETSDEGNEDGGDKKHPQKKRLLKKRYRKTHPKEGTAESEKAPELKVLSERAGTEEETISEDIDVKPSYNAVVDEDAIDDDDDELELDFELQRKLLRARKLFHRSKIQDVIKEGQILLVQIVKEERGNKGAALTTYLSLAGRYCVLMPNRIKSGGVSRKITNAQDRNRLKGIVKELPLTSDMSIIVRTAGEEKTKADIVRDYNYLIRAWNNVRIDSLKAKAPALIHEEGNLIKRALRDIYTKDTAEIIVAGDEAYKLAKDFFKILSPHNLKKIKNYKNSDMPLFQRFQVEGQLDKLHEANAQLESGGYLVINPTEALVSIDVNSGRATKEKDLEETALKTNLEACDEIARQLRLRNLAGLVVIDFIDMEEQANNHAIEKRMKEALKKDRSRIQVGKMSMFGLLELSRQRMHSSFFESSYQVCPHCQGKGIVRTMESTGVFVLRGIEEEGIKGRSSRINVYVPAETAIYLLNQKRQTLIALEQKYKLEVIISADDSIKCISDYRIERTKSVRNGEDNGNSNSESSAPNGNECRSENRNENRNNNRNRNGNNNKPTVKEPVQEEVKEVSENAAIVENQAENQTDRNEVSEDNDNRDGNYRNRRRRDNRRRNRNRFDNRRNGNNEAAENEQAPNREKQEAVILYNSHEDITSKPTAQNQNEEPVKEKSTWWKKLIKG